MSLLNFGSAALDLANTVTSLAANITTLLKTFGMH